MARFVVGVLLMALAVTTRMQGFPTGLDDVSTAAAAGDWKKVSEILDAYYKTRFGLEQKQQQQYQGFPSGPQGFGSTNVRSLKPEGGGRVYATAEYSYHAATNDNGQVRQVSGGHKIVNDNGNVTEIDYTPKY